MRKENSAPAHDGKDRGRNERLAKALRENLRRRKSQTRNRDEESRAGGSGQRAPYDKDSKQP